MRRLKKYLKFLKENTLAPTKPGVKPPPTKPLPPVKPERRDRKISEPKVKPGPKALEELSEMVAYTFIAEMSKSNESVKKYLD